MWLLRILKWENYSGLSRYAAPTCNHKHRYKKEAKGDLTTGLRDMKMEARAGGRDHELRNAGTSKSLEMEVDSPLEPPEELSTANALTLGQLILIADIWPLEH